MVEYMSSEARTGKRASSASSAMPSSARPYLRSRDAAPALARGGWRRGLGRPFMNVQASRAVAMRGGVERRVQNACAVCASARGKVVGEGGGSEGRACAPLARTCDLELEQGDVSLVVHALEQRGLGHVEAAQVLLRQVDALPYTVLPDVAQNICQLRSTQGKRI
eukprot:6189180-Pleurochrysis_carterae.AAC.2